MPDSDIPVDEIQVGDRVAYKLSTGKPAPGIRGKVIGIFNTRDGKILVDVQWDKLSSPRRLNICSLTKI